MTKYGWILKPCPDSAETVSCGQSYLHRSCVYKSQGFYLQPKDQGVENKLLFRFLCLRLNKVLILRFISGPIRREERKKSKFWRESSVVENVFQWTSAS